MVQFTVRPGLVIETALISRLQKLFSDVALQKHFRNQVVYLTVYLEPWDKLLSDHDLLARISKILKALLPVSIDFVSQEDLHEMWPHDRYLPVVNYLRQHAIAKVEGWVEDYPRNGLPFAREKVFRRRDAEYA
ncbi:hypothetical protein N7470_003513 [Penicillium chermesinum]|nr:hypothetical protein N7470_003513 [Penicillium chermesinum]